MLKHNNGKNISTYSLTLAENTYNYQIVDTSCNECKLYFFIKHGLDQACPKCVLKVDTLYREWGPFVGP